MRAAPLRLAMMIYPGFCRANGTFFPINGEFLHHGGVLDKARARARIM
jgi:hypothetical protein